MPSALLLGIDRSEIRQEAAERALRRQKVVVGAYRQRSKRF